MGGGETGLSLSLSPMRTFSHHTSSAAAAAAFTCCRLLGSLATWPSTSAVLVVPILYASLASISCPQQQLLCYESLVVKFDLGKKWLPPPSITTRLLLLLLVLFLATLPGAFIMCRRENKSRLPKHLRKLARDGARQLAGFPRIRIAASSMW